MESLKDNKIYIKRIALYIKTQTMFWHKDLYLERMVRDIISRNEIALEIREKILDEADKRRYEINKKEN